MKALVYTGVKEMTFQDAADPKLVAGENLIKIGSVGICGSDMHGYLGHDARRPAPLILGHEAAGLVIEGPLAGKRVTVNPLVPCGTCRFCGDGRMNLCPNRQLISMPPREGAFAEFLTMPSENLIEIPDHVSDDHAALAEPLAVCWHAMRLGKQTLYPDLSEASCLIVGGGAIGVGSALSLTAMGARNVTISEPNVLRHDVLNGLGDYRVTTPDALEGQFDLVVDAVGYKATREMASEITEPGGVIVHIGLGDNNGGFDARRMTLQEITAIGTYCYTKQDFADTAAAIYDGRFGSLDWIETRDLSDGANAFSDILAGKVASPKIILHP